METSADRVNIFSEDLNGPSDDPNDPRMGAPCDHGKTIRRFHDQGLLIKNTPACIGPHLTERENVRVYLSRFIDFDKRTGITEDQFC